MESFASGTLSFLEQLVKRQIQYYDIYILYGIRPLTPNNVEELFPKEIHLIKAKHFNGATKTIINPLAYLEVNKTIKNIQPDIIHLHSTAAGIVGRIVTYNMNVKTFYTPHGYAFLQEDLSPLKKYILKSSERFLAKLPCTIIACGKGEYKIGYSFTDRVVVINNGVDTTEADSILTIPKISSNSARICACGRITKQKAPELFNQIATQLPDVQFTWIGDGDLRNVLTSSNITVTGWVNHKETLKEMHKNDFYILTTYGEGLPLSLIDAMYMNLPCLASNVRGCKDVIVDGQNGFLCNNAEDFVKKIKQLSNDRNLYNCISRQGHEVVMRDFNLDKMAEDYRKVYESN